ncbi:AfsR/SARP family transcriptional regulator [Streptomyces sp. NBC_00400]|uniref:AfsR/SARP family transcriptional regulator n=1 Tax=Streptomyces sp. NBC_00400 TaxID=2975737 RepID=UPI002E232E25
MTRDPPASCRHGQQTPSGHRRASPDTLLWDWIPPSTSDAQLYTYASRIRAALGSAADIVREAGPTLSNTTEYLITTEAAQLEERRAIALESRIEADLALGRHRALVPELTGLVARQPLRERLRVQLMTALCRADRQADAIGTHTRAA